MRQIIRSVGVNPERPHLKPERSGGGGGSSPNTSPNNSEVNYIMYLFLFNYPS